MAEEFLRGQKGLVAMEREAELSEADALLSSARSISAKQLESAGLAIRSLRVSATRTGLSGRCVVKLTRQPLPATRIGAGDVVSLRQKASDSGFEGVVLKVRETSVAVAFDEPPTEVSDGGSAWWMQPCLVLTRLANDVTYRRMRAALDALETQGAAKLCTLHRALLGIGVLHGPQVESSGESYSAASGLNSEQEDAVRGALSTLDVALIHGPPGTGKTSTVAELIRRIVVERGERVLACAPSNIAVDNLAEKLAAKLGTKRLVRVGHPARVMASVAGISLDARVSHHTDSDVVNELRRDIARVRSELGKRGAARREARAELAELSRDLRVREGRILKSVLVSAAVVLSTCTGAGDSTLLSERFDWVIIDEAAQATEAACWIPLLRSGDRGRCVLAGDDKQLPPTIKSKQAASAGFAVTLFERLHKRHGDRITRMLRVQYRMNEAIMAWASKQMYNSSLIADPSVAHHLLAHISGVSNTPGCLSQTPLLIVDTAGCGLSETLEERDEVALCGDSKLNEGEASIVVSVVRELVAAGVKVPDIGVITPYNAQVNFLRSELSGECRAGLEISSVDGFQGREKEAIVFSFVRSNPQREVGFLKEDRRTNVAITRARRFVCIVCDSDTISAHPFLASTVGYFSENGEIRTPDSDESAGPAFTAAASAAPIPAPAMERNAQKKPKSKVPAARPFSLEHRLLSFAENTLQSRLELPATLTSFERMKAHELAEQLGLEHSSHGAGTERHIVLVKKRQPAIPPPPSPPQPTLSDPEKSAAATKRHPRQPKAPAASPFDEEELEEVVPVEEDVRPPSPTKPTGKGKQQQQPHQRKKGKRAKVAAAGAAADGEDLDALLKELDIDNKHCAFRAPRCKTIVDTIGLTCRFCRKRFCFAHIQPEVHGCGPAAKKEAQDKARHDFEQRQTAERLERFVIHPPRGRGRTDTSHKPSHAAEEARKKKKKKR